MKEHDTVVLVTDVPEQGLMIGDIGCVVHVYEHEKGFEVEFVNLAGETHAVVTLAASKVQPVTHNDLRTVVRLRRDLHGPIANNDPALYLHETLLDMKIMADRSGMRFLSALIEVAAEEARKTQKNYQSSEIPEFKKA
ncbi:MAG: DUF4926 domain-containing protein [Hyphomicrobiales bacterium]|nr:DUF4926 domain-containing protein [Hyphomicrobiales bacterium]